MYNKFVALKIQAIQQINFVNRDNSQAMMYLAGPGDFGYCNIICCDICSRAKVLLGRQQWSIGVFFIYFTIKNTRDLQQFYKNLMSITSLVLGASVNTRLALGLGDMA